MAQDWNIFCVGRDFGDENQLTNMLAWLASRVSAAGGALLSLALPDVETDGFESLEVATQQWTVTGVTDAVLRTPSSTVVIESKLGRDYGEDQLERYLDWLAETTVPASRRALMTLTAREAPWPQTATNRATELGIVAVERGWKDVYVALGAALEHLRTGGIESALMSEFREMLKNEGLVPVSPLGSEELLDLWSRGDAIISRYHDFFKTCRPAIARGLGAASLKNRVNVGQTYVYEEFKTSAEIVTIGLYSDSTVVAKPKQARRAPVIWMAFYSEAWSDWAKTILTIEAAPPPDWQVSRKRWYQQPQFWRYLSDVVQDGSLEQQHAALEAAAHALSSWFDALRTEHAKPKRTLRHRRSA